MAQVTPFFATPFAFAEYENHQQMHRELRALFLSRESAGGQHANPRPLTKRNAAVFESNFQLFQSCSAC